MEVEVISHRFEVLEALETQARAALEACGNQAVSHAKQNITAAGRIDTGRLINSMTHLVEDDTCTVGTNVEYAIYHEVGSGIYGENGGRQTPWAFKDINGEWHLTHGVKPTHFLRDAIADNVAEYEQIIHQYLSD